VERWHAFGRSHVDVRRVMVRMGWRNRRVPGFYPRTRGPRLDILEADQGGGTPLRTVARRRWAGKGPDSGNTRKSWSPRSPDTMAKDSRRPLTDWQKRLYLATRTCPHCADNRTRYAGSFRPRKDGTARLRVRCTACKATWVEVWKLKTIADRGASRPRLFTP
jgi:hypothetical protein